LFYVDPKTNCLRELPQREPLYRHPAAPLELFTERDGRHFKQIDGVWYEIELRPLATQPVADALFSRQENGTWEPLYEFELKRLYGRSVYAARKRQLNKKEIRWLTAGS
jgi:hypothetical protein